MEKYIIKYGCGCEHEIEINDLKQHKPTGKNKDCEQHKLN
jgi:hypothetical protein